MVWGVSPTASEAMREVGRVCLPLTVMSADGRRLGCRRGLHDFAAPLSGEELRPFFLPPARLVAAI